MQLTTISILEDKDFNILVDDVNDKIIAPYLLENKVWEPMVTNIVTRLLSEGLTAIDVGANIGYYTLLFSKIVGDAGKVFSFEPEEHNFSILQENVLLNNLNNVVLENKALSDTKGSAYLYLANENKGDHRLSCVADRHRCIVDLISFDEYMKAYEGDIHFVKSDTQGHELKVLNGMKDMIQKNIDHFCCLLEFSPGLLNSQDVGGLDAFLDFFDAYDAEIYWLKEGLEETRLTLVNKELLQKIALEILKHFEVDRSYDLVIFFNEKARSSYFEKLGIT